MTTTTRTSTLDDLDSWAEVRSYACLGMHAATATRGATQVLVLLLESAYGTGLALSAVQGGLRAQDRRRLHRLGLREGSTGIWLAAVPRPRPPREDGVLASIQASRAYQDARGDLVLHVLRDALRVDLDSVVVSLEEDDWLEDEE